MLGVAMVILVASCGSVSDGDARRLDAVVAAEPLRGAPGLVEVERRERAVGGADDVSNYASAQRANTVEVVCRPSADLSATRDTVRSSLLTHGFEVRSESCPSSTSARLVATQQLPGFEVVAEVVIDGDRVTEIVTAPPDPVASSGEIVPTGRTC